MRQRDFCHGDLGDNLILKSDSITKLGQARLWWGRTRVLLANWQTRWGGLAAIALAVWMALTAFPAAPAPDGTELDQSWALALNLAHSGKLAPGKDVIWTYGPLGYLSQPSPTSGEEYFPLLYRLGMYGLWAAALIRLRRRPWMIVTLGLAALIDPFIATDHLEVALYAIIVLALLDSPGWRDAELAIVAFLAGISLLGKESLGLQAVTMLACLMAALFWRHRSWTRQVLLPLAILLATVTGLYWVSTRDLSSFPLYVRTSWQLISGYAENMSTPGPAWQVALAIAALAILLIGVPVAATDRKKLMPVLPLTAAAAFFVFKSSIVRQEHAHFVSFGPKLLLASLFLLAAAQAVRSRRVLIAFQAACLVFAYSFAVASWPATPWLLEQRLVLNQSMLWMEFFLKWPQTWKNLETAGKGNLSMLKVSPIYRDEIGTHSADSIPWDVALIRANGWPWKPRPVFQSYAAYTPMLDKIDAQHTESDDAADFLLVNWKAIDERNPFLEEPLTWRERLNYYQTDLHDRNLLLLRRREEPRFGTEVDFSRKPTQAGWDEEIPVPDDPGVQVRLSVAKSRWGSLRVAVFRLNPVWLLVTRKSGRQERWRVVRANLQDGIRIRELPGNLEDVALLAQAGCRIPDPVVSFRLHTDTPADYSRVIGLQWGSETQESVPCMQLSETQAFLDVSGGPGAVKMTADRGQVFKADSKAPWVQAEPQDGGIRYTVEPNLAAAARLGKITVSGLQFRIFQAGISSWTAVFRPAGAMGLFLFGGADARTSAFGAAGDQPVVGDWTGTGVSRIGVYRRGAWFLDLNNNGKWDGPEGGDGYYDFGLPDDRPVVGDWNGDGTTKLGVYRAGLWVLDVNGTHKYDPTLGEIRAFHFGLPTDLPVVSNWRHTGKQDQVGVFRNGMWYVDSNGNEKYEANVDDLYPFGLAGDIPVVVDWGKDGGKKIGVYRRGQWILDKNGDNRYDAGDLVFSSGKAGDVPLTGHWK